MLCQSQKCVLLYQENRNKLTKIQPMAENHLQVVSLMSNLISDNKVNNLCIGNYKSFQVRNKYTIYANTFQMIKHTISQREKLENMESTEGEKENKNGIFGVSKFREFYEQEIPLITQVPKLNARTFLIRSQNIKKSNKSNASSRNKLTEKSQIQEKSPTFSIPLKEYNFQSAAPLKINPILTHTSCHKNSANSQLAIFFPFSLINNSNQSAALHHYSKLFESLFHSQIQIYLITTQSEESNRIPLQFRKYCHILHLQILTLASGRQKQIFIDLNQSILTLPHQILFIHPYYTNIENPYFFPYFHQRQHSNDLSGQQNEKLFSGKGKKIGFMKIKLMENLRFIKIGQDSSLQITMKQSLCKKIQKIKQEIYPLSSMVKLQIQTKNRRKKRRKSRQNIPLPSQSFSEFQTLQQKLISYSKILKKQSQSDSEHKLLNNRLQPRKSVPNKSSYQLIYQLVHNNSSIHKQMQTFIMNYKDINIQQEDIVCDDATYYIIQ